MLYFWKALGMTITNTIVLGLWHSGVLQTKMYLLSIIKLYHIYFLSHIAYRKKISSNVQYLGRTKNWSWNGIHNHNEKQNIEMMKQTIVACFFSGNKWWYHLLLIFTWEQAWKGPATLKGLVKLWWICAVRTLLGVQIDSKADHNPHTNWDWWK
jgi:hypothetical protein